MFSILTSVEDDKRIIRQAEAERKQKVRERWEFKDARQRHWEHIEQDYQAHLKSLEGANAEREAAAIEAYTKASEMHKAQHQTDLASQKKQAILQDLPKPDDHTDPEAFLATFEAAIEENFLTEEWIKNIRKLLTGKASSINREMNVTAEHLSCYLRHHSLRDLATLRLEQDTKYSAVAQEICNHLKTTSHPY